MNEHETFNGDGDESRNLVDAAYEMKNERCNQLLSCLEEYSSYDLFVHMFADDINFEEGVIDNHIQRASSKYSNFLDFRDRMATLVGELRSFLNSVDSGSASHSGKETGISTL